VFEMPPADVGLAFGGIAAVAGGIGSLGGGLLADRLAKRDARWYAWLSAGVAPSIFS
jgi:hypothetical protein